MSTEIKYAVIQSGYCVFGTGATERAAIEDAAQWLEDEFGRQGGLTPEEVEAQLAPRYGHVDGDLIVVRNDDQIFDSYLENQGGFEKRGGQWFRVS